MLFKDYIYLQLVIQLDKTQTIIQEAILQGVALPVLHNYELHYNKIKDDITVLKKGLHKLSYMSFKSTGIY